MPRSSSTEAAARSLQTEPLGRFLAINLAAALIAAVAALVCGLLSVPVWTMFVGWVVYFSRGQSTWDGVVNILCLALGIAFGLVASFLVGPLLPILGFWSVPSFVLATSFLVMSLRGLPVINNIPAYFLGLTSVFAAQAQPGIEEFMQLAVASAIGGLAGWAARSAQAKLTPKEREGR
jgi:hypothetical protein